MPKNSDKSFMTCFFPVGDDVREIVANWVDYLRCERLPEERAVGQHHGRPPTGTKAEFRIDPDEIYLIGESSGGHLVSLAASLGDGPYARVGGWQKARNDVRAVISVAGTYDLPTLSWGNLWTPMTGDVDANVVRRRRSTTSDRR